jgi:DNA-nicking Smr family endonuclease
MALRWGAVNGNDMAREEDEDAFREAMATLGVKPGGRSARAAAPRRAPEAKAPEVLDELDFDQLMRAEVSAPSVEVGARRDEAASAGRAPTPTTEAAPKNALRHEVSPEERALFERAIAGLDAGRAPKPERVGSEGPVRTAPRPAAPDYARLLKHGRLVFDATCDLHGATREEARAQLGRFLEESVRERWRVLRIVVGKGYHSVGEPVLRGAVRGWLSGVFAEDVEQVLDAPEAAGGSGALVVIATRR